MLVWFSCGAASAVAAKIATAEYASEFSVEVCYCDLLADEHPDNLRFLQDVEAWIGQPIRLLRSPKYRTIHEVFRGERYVVGPRGAPCSRLLKQRVRVAYQRPGDVHVLGFTAEEGARAKRFASRWPELDEERILIDRGIPKEDCHHMLCRAGIEQPMMYRLGYHNNNCLGCVKGGMGYWNQIRKDFPGRFAEMARIEREIGATILRRRGQRVYLDELDPQVGRHDKLDIGDCGLFCEARLAAIGGCR